MRSRYRPLQAQPTHQALHALTVDDLAVASQPVAHPAAAEERGLQVLLVDARSYRGQYPPAGRA